MNSRIDAQKTFLANAGWAGAAIAPLAADASFRSYHRVSKGDRAAVLMDAPPEHEDITPFVRVAKYLTQHGFSAPRIIFEDEKRGFLLLEDLGDQTYTRELAAGGDEAMLYELAIDTLAQLHETAAPENLPADIPPYDMDRLMAEVMLFVDWYVPAASDRNLGQVARGDYEAVWQETFAALASRRETLVLRDYHVDNLMWLQDRTGTAQCGLLDFQDALSGARAYDLMSLLEDARREVAPDLKEHMIQRYLVAMEDMDEAALRHDMAILGAGRHAKVIGIFTRLSRRDGKSQYLAHIPHVWSLLENSLAHPALSSVANWFKRHVPAELRVIPSSKKLSANE